MKPIVLSSARLELRAPGVADIDTITQCCQDADVQRWTTVPSPYSREDAEQFVRGVVEPGWRMGTGAIWGIRTDAREALVGMIGLHGIAHGGGELGFWLRPSARGKGIMGEAVQLVCDFGFAPAANDRDSGAATAGLGLRRIQWHAIAGNAASATVARRARFQFEGVKRLGGVQRGTRVDAWSAGLLSTDDRTRAAGWPPDTLVTS